jgi:uncharacterized protein (TIGR03435 family)
VLSGIVGRQVIDKSGIKHNVDIHMEFAPDDMKGVEPPAPTDSPRPSIFVAIREQLGLKLEAVKMPGDILVVDQLQRPTEN